MLLVYNIEQEARDRDQSGRSMNDIRGGRQCLDDQDDRIRYSAMTGLGKVAKKGDKDALRSLFTRLPMEGRAGRKQCDESTRTIFVDVVLEDLC